MPCDVSCPQVQAELKNVKQYREKVAGLKQALVSHFTFTQIDDELSSCSRCDEDVAGFRGDD